MSIINKNMISVEIILEPNYIKSPPQVDIYINNKKIKTCIFDKANKSVKYKFDIESQTENTIRMHRYGKTNKDTVIVDGKTIEDQTLNIENIIIEKIPLENLLHLGTFYPDYPEPWATQQRKLGVNLPESETYRSKIYHNGNWYFNFETPIHPWFFSNLNVSF